MITLAVDCMGGDHGPRVTLAACRQFLDSHPDTRLLLVGQPDALAGFAHERASVVPASEVVGMDDPIEMALRRKKDSSMRIAIQQVKDGAAAAAVSAGNTGALMAISRYLLKTLDGIDRPAIAPQLPNAKGEATTVLDLGANVDCSAEHLLQFAVMGSALVSALNNEEAPSVGLLNIGEEQIKEELAKPGRLEELRRRLSSISWHMIMLKEPIARAANKEDGVRGHFFAERFDAVKLEDGEQRLATSLRQLRTFRSETRVRDPTCRTRGARFPTDWATRSSTRSISPESRALVIESSG